MNVRKRLVLGSVVAAWICLATFVIAVDFLSTGIVQDICVPWGAFRSYVDPKILTACCYSITYVTPTSLMVFCYVRIVYVLTRKVTFERWHNHGLG